MVHFAVMSRRLLAPALLAVWGMASQAGPTFASGESAEPQQLPYQGRHGDTNWPQMVRQRVAPLLPQALFRASDLLGDEVDTNRVDVRLMDIIPRDKSFISSMYTYGYGRPTLGIPIEPLIRGEFQDEEDLLATMTHELIHVYMRQHLQQAEYNAIPEWFQEGLPTYLCGQLSGKLGSALALTGTIRPPSWRDSGATMPTSPTLPGPSSARNWRNVWAGRACRILSEPWPQAGAWRPDSPACPLGSGKPGRAPGSGPPKPSKRFRRVWPTI